MAKVIPFEELNASTHGAGYVEDKWAKVGQKCEEAESYTRPVVWLSGVLMDEGGTWRVANIEDDYNKYHVPTKAEVDEAMNDDGTTFCGERVWDSEPTEEEIKNTSWVVTKT